MPSHDLVQGHRKRLRQKFIKSGLAGFHDYEIIELLLTLGPPRKDCKLQAKEAIEKFKTLWGVLEASPEELQQISGIGPHSAFGIKLVQEVARKYLKERIVDKPVYKSAQEIFNYLYHHYHRLTESISTLVFMRISGPSNLPLNEHWDVCPVMRINI
jgi:DNA repair protein RadC